MANKTYNDHPTDNTPAADDLIPYWDVAAGAAKKAVRAAVIGATITGAGTIATGGNTLTVPASGTAALREAANTFTANQYFSGLVSIGTLSPSSNLHVVGTGNVRFDSSTSGTFTRYLFDTSTSSNYTMTFATGNSIQVKRNDGYVRSLALQAEGGYVGIGTNSPSYALDVAGDINASGAVRSNEAPLTSDARLKDDVQPLADSLSKVRQARGVSFAWKDDDKDAQKHIGFVAQEIEQIFPDLVSEWIVDGETIKCVDYARMVPALLEAVKELAGRVDALTAAAKA